ncbi:MAG: hypothetical protein HYR90_02085 [Candidatus Andersenbacteria bacterium]|nr:hypothetical protein [Candidatus Andersenbacteria bacterium]MBI3250950.1 hypothetical protein [Candidatus Andersenbacteria bacterium]
MKGFTVVETVVVLGLSLMLITALLRFLVAGYPLASVTLLQSNSNETARVQLKRIAKEMRQIRYADTGAYPLVDMLPQKMVFYANIDTDAATERVRYELNGTDLTRAILEPSGNPITYNVANEHATVVARNIRNGTNPIFVYYNGDYPEDTVALTPADVTDVKYIQFHLLIDANPDREPNAIEVASQVQLRNLKTNLGQTTDP